MDLLYRVGGLSGTKIGEMMGVDYSTVSPERNQLREKLKGDKHLSQIIKRVEVDLSLINRLSENAASLFSSFSRNNEGNSVAIVQFNDTIKRNEIFKAKPHRAVKSLPRIDTFNE